MLEKKILGKLKDYKNLILIIVVLFLGVSSFVLYRYYSQDFGIEQIASDVETGYSVDYFVYADEELEGRENVPLIVHTFHAGIEDEVEGETIEERAYQTTRSLHSIAREIDGVMVVPAFSLTESPEKSINSQSIISRYEQTGAELKAIIDDIKSRMQERNINLADRVNLFGFGYSALYASRWQLMYPETVKTAVLGAPGEWPAVPAEEFEDNVFDYPLGLTGLEDKTERSEALEEIAVFHFQGQEDEFSVISDTRIFADKHRQQLQDLAEQNNEYLDIVSELFTRNSLEYKYSTYEDVDHRFNLEMHDDVVEFLEKHN